MSRWEDWGNFRRDLRRTSQSLASSLTRFPNPFRQSPGTSGLLKGMRLANPTSQRRECSGWRRFLVATFNRGRRRSSCLKERILWKPEGAAKRPHSKTGWNQSSLAKQWRPNPADACCTMPQRAGMRSSLQGKRARLAGELHFPIRARHGSRDGQTVIVESEIQSINIPK